MRNSKTGGRKKRARIFFFFHNDRQSCKSNRGSTPSCRGGSRIWQFCACLKKGECPALKKPHANPSNKLPKLECRRATRGQHVYRNPGDVTKEANRCRRLFFFLICGMMHFKNKNSSIGKAKKCKKSKSSPLVEIYSEFLIGP